MYEKIINLFKNESFYNYFNNYKINNILNLINDNQNKIKNLSDYDIKKKINELKNDLIFNKNDLNVILPKTYSIVKESCRRIFNFNLFDSQLICGIILHSGNIAEMNTGEGKTLSATLPSFLNSLKKDNNVHVVTSNDYLANRDFINNKPLFNFLGIKIGLNISTMSLEEKKRNYTMNIVYGNNNEFCFDYLKDNLILNKKDRIQKKLDYVIIDEIDSILIDEAKTPIVISEFNNINNNNKNNIYYTFNKISKNFTFNKNNIEKNLEIDYKNKQVFLKNSGYKILENLLFKKKIIKYKKELYLKNNIIYIKNIINAIKANIFFKKNIDYILNKNNEIEIIDEYTGRKFQDRKWADGIQEAIESKEKLKISFENFIIASISFQNYFLLYKKLSGMTSTAYSEREEFKEVYNLKIFKIKTNKPIIRKDLNDLFFINNKEKFKKIVEDVLLRKNNKQPILIGTISIKKSEEISKILKKFNIKHKVLNAKKNDIEAEIIAKAGEPGSITIATNMAGRGTDIILGGNKYNNINNWKIKNNLVIKKGGLHIIGTERNYSRRIDDQLIGRSGRQGDPGSSQFYLSLEDNLIKNFLPNKIFNFIKKFGKEIINSISNSLINKYIKDCQKSNDLNNYQIRKQLTEYDNIINIQRNIIFKIRNNIINNEKIFIFNNIYKKNIKNILNEILNKNEICFHNKKLIDKILFEKMFIKIKFKINEKNYNLEFNKKIFNDIIYNINILNKIYSYKIINNIKKHIFIRILDNLWRNYLNIIENIKKNVFLRIYINKDPKLEYKIETYNLFYNILKIWELESTLMINKVFYYIINNFKNINIIQSNYLNNEDIKYIIFLIKNIIKNKKKYIF